MADQSISQLPVAVAPLTGDELAVVVQNGITKQTSLQNVADLGGPAGPQGPQGPVGPPGNAATIEVQSTTTTAPGTDAEVINIGSPYAAYFEFYIPRGDTGATGATGPQGPAGPGVAAGGTVNQYLRKVDSTDYNTNWADLPTYVSSVAGTANQINVATGTTNAVVSLANNPVLPGTAAFLVPKGTTAQRAGVTATNGLIRYNTETLLFEGYINGAWASFASGSGVTSVGTGTGLTGGPITSTGTISIDSTVVTLDGTQTLTNKSMDGVDNTFTNLPNSAFVNDAITIGSTSVALGDTITSLVGLTEISIGTSTAPSGALFTITNDGYFAPQIINTAGNGLDIYIANGTNENYIGAGAGSQGAGELYIWTNAANPLGFYTAGTLRQSIDGDGVSVFRDPSYYGAYTPFGSGPIVAVADTNTYKEVYGINLNSGSDASFDFVAYNDASDVNSYFIDMGMNSSGYTSATYPIFTPNSGYVFTGGGTSNQQADLFLGNSNTNSNIVFFTGGFETANTRAVITGNTGNFLIGTLTDDGYNLAVGGTTKFSGASLFGDTVTLNADPLTNLEAATKQYVDAKATTGLNYHAPVQCATTTNLATTTGGTVTYNAPGPEGVGATLTLSVALSVLDGYTLLNTNRILVKDEANQAHNGIYTWATGGTVLTRATDADTYGSAETQLSQNDYFYVQNGTVNRGSAWVVSTIGPINFTTTPITFGQFSSSQIYTGTSPIDVTSTVISLTTVPATLGGTGTSTVATGDLLYGSGTNAWSKLALGSAYKSLIVNASGTQLEWNSVPLNQTTAVSGQLSVSNGGTGASTLTGYLVGNGTSPFTAVATIPNSGLTNSSITINGSSVSLGGSVTVTATASNALTIGTGLSGTSYNGSTAVTIAISNTGVSAASYGSASKTLTATVNAQGQLTALAETNIAIANTQVSGLGTMSTQNANAVVITGGTIDGTTIGASSAAAITGTTITATKYVGISGGTF
jgi:hypothetical protein